MKRKVLITCMLVVFALLPSVLQKAVAQSNLVEMSTTFQSRNSIVREYKENIFLIYNYDIIGDYTFNLINVLTGSCLSIKLPSVSVNDFEIANDTAYFCGSIGTTVVAGWFSVYDVFYAGSPITMVFVPTSLSCAYWSSCTEEIVSLDRLEVIEYNNGFNHLVMVGKATCTESSTTNTCIAEIYYNGPDCKLEYQVEHWGVFAYSDIAVTSNKVIVVGNKWGSEGEYWTPFDKPPYNQDMFSCTLTPTPPYSYYTYGTGDPLYIPHHESKLLMDDIPGTTRFATVCQAEGCTSPGVCPEGTYLNLYINCSTIVHRCRIDDYHSLTYTELKYNPNTNSFFLLMEDCATNRHNGYYEFVLNNTMTSVTDVFFHQEQNYDTYVSLDISVLSKPNRQCVLTGYDNTNNLYIWYHDPLNQQDCSMSFNIPYSARPISSCQFEYDFPHNTVKLIPAVYTGTVKQSDLKTICYE